MRVILPPVGLPVSVSALAEQAHIDEAEGPQLTALILAATAVVETATNRPILKRTVEIALPDEPWSEFWLPVAPCHALVDAPGAVLLRGYDEPRIRRGDYGGDTIRAEVGYRTATDAPQQLLQAIILLVLEWRAAGITVEGQFLAPQLSFGVQRLLRQIRYRRPQEMR